VQTLVELLATLKDSTGKVAVKRFYDDVTPLTAMESKALDAIPNVDAQLKKSIGFAEEEIKGKDLIHSIHLPSLNINGIESSNVGTIQANVIPISATAVLDLRLVPGNDWQRQQQKVIDHIRSHGFEVVTTAPDSVMRATYPKLIQVTRGFGDNAYRTPLDWPTAQKVIAVLNSGLKEPVLQVPTLGGTLPLNTLVKELGARPLVLPIANPDNNQHAENENIQMKHLREGIDMLASLMLGLG
jgi:acetylornithine deacetylase/succinyl-diaminopimelate desuccinylase-like protein